MSMLHLNIECRRGTAMDDATSHYGSGRGPVRPAVAWIFAALIIFAGVFGPPITGRSMPALVELRHEVLMIDREFERFAWTGTVSGRTSPVTASDLGRAGANNTLSAIPTRGGSP